MIPDSVKHLGHRLLEDTGVRSSFLTVFWHNVKNDLTLRLFACDWVVDIRDPIEQPEYVLEYLARYTHRVAIANNSILCLEEDNEVRSSFLTGFRHNVKNEDLTLICSIPI
jgi:hypothetical protein